MRRFKENSKAKNLCKQMCVANKTKQLALVKVKNRQLLYIQKNYKQIAFIKIIKEIL
jgi:hypothetical protein